MHNESTAPPPAIGGWLILVAYKLLLILSFSFKSLMFNFPFITMPDIANTYPIAVFLAYHALALALSVYVALLFFGRSIEFRRVFTALVSIETVYIVTGFAFNYKDMVEYQLLDPYRIGQFFLPVLFSVACVAYLFFSRRVKNTFVFDRNAPDPAICFTKDSVKDTVKSLQIYGLLIVADAQAVSITDRSLRGFMTNPLFTYQEGNLETLLCLAVFAASIFCILLFFERKKLFRWVFIGLVVVSVLYNAYITYTAFFHAVPLNTSRPSIWHSGTSALQ